MSELVASLMVVQLQRAAAAKHVASLDSDEADDCDEDAVEGVRHNRQEPFALWPEPEIGQTAVVSHRITP